MSETIPLTLPDGKVLQVPKGATVLDAAKLIGPKLAQVVIAAKLDDKLVDLSHKVEKPAKFVLFKPDSKEGLEIFRHSTAHVLAQAALRVFPDVKITIGPAIEEGFYYDFFRKEPFTPEDLATLEAEMKKIVDEDQPFERVEITKEDALKLYPDNVFKRELTEAIPDETVSIYYNRKTANTPAPPTSNGHPITSFTKEGDFYDLCTGPHVPSTGRIKAFKLTKMSSAYWRGDSAKDTLQRIYGISFEDEKKLQDYFAKLEEAEKRDHRKLGRELELFAFHEWSPGSPFILPKGAIIYNELLAYVRDQYVKRGYKEVITPQLYHKGLWEQSGHWHFYQENMFTLQVDDTDFALKPMNCPSHMLMYNMSAHSYRDLPLRIADFCMLHRNELKGVLGGMTRVRKFSQDDAHIFLAPEQIGEEIDRLIDFVKFVYVDTFKFTFTAKLSTRPEKYMGDLNQWAEAEKHLEEALKRKGIPYVINPGDGAFYGPKVDFEVKDALGRGWQLATVQVDYQLPARFKCEYEGSDGQRHTCVVLHRAIIGSMERFMGILVEHYAGLFPVWLSPVQVAVLPISKDSMAYAKALHEKFMKEGFRSSLDERDDTIASKIRDAQLQKVPYMLAIGKNELETGRLAVRDRKGRMTQMAVDDFVKHMKQMVKEKKQIE